MEKLVKFLNVIKKDICSFTDYKTRSPRSEYFYWYLASVLASFIKAYTVKPITKITANKPTIPPILFFLLFIT